MSAVYTALQLTGSYTNPRPPSRGPSLSRLITRSLLRARYITVTMIEANKRAKNSGASMAHALTSAPAQTSTAYGDSHAVMQKSTLTIVIARMTRAAMEA
ncbi:hypothetical protein WOLCODRAFT_165501 [Wolfiporia cocos MD-104 SS10]|uniref:Uncharacterized protein n=1 Tax=Wolfiporia cocos (strain MD-104) TaxID=742152 RepID=A0A2H3K176_WOLCO|nr:hypothetical protein WOLCODRAFT_165501 [Wolfiporia cocos MD-104 SS10]